MEYSKQSGYVLIELIVAISLFLAVTAIAVGGFVRGLRIVRENAAFMAAGGNMSLILEQITRELRTGYDICSADQLCSEERLSFKNAKGDVVVYQQVEESIERLCQGVCDGEPGAKIITPESVVARDLTFSVSGNFANDGYQPRVTVSVGVGTKTSGGSESVVRLQTTISPRFPLDS